MLPRITHQTAATTRLAPEQAELRGRLIAFNPEWEHRFYTDADCRDLIRRRLPTLLPVYDAYPTAIQRADMFRVVVIYLSGGVYLDLDVELLTPLDPLLDHACVLAEEKTLSVAEAQARGHAETLRIANYMFGAAPRHPFWLDVLEAMVERADRPISTDDDILESTGPGLFSSVFAQVREAHPDLVVLAHPGLSCPRCCGPSCHFGPLARHLHHGSWRLSRPPPLQPRPEGHVAFKPTAELLRRHSQLVGDTVVLQCYAGEAMDGLSSVQALTNALGPSVADSRSLSGAKVIVPGIPFLHEDRLSPDNRNVAYTTFESSSLPLHWVRSLNRAYHHVVVPHDRVAEVFRDSGVVIPISVVGQSFRRLPKVDTPPRGSVQRIGFLGVPVARKNLGGLYLACQRLKPRWPGLQLAVHVSTWYDWLNRGAWRAVRADPMVDWTEGPLDDAGLARWFAGLSCYAYPSRAEGWSFTPRESLYLGLPTLVSDIGIHRELAGSGFCHVVRSRGVEPALYEGGRFGDWDQIEPEDIAVTLEQILSDPMAAERRATAGARWMETQWIETDAQAALAKVVAAL
jgi:hypothetical protein